MRVVILADGSLAAQGVCQALRYVKGLTVAGYVDHRRPCTDTMIASAPELIVVDDIDASQVTLDRVSESRRAAPDAKIVMLTRTMEAEWLRQASTAGVDAAIGRHLAAATLGTLVGQIAEGNVFHTFRPAAPVPVSPTVAELTARELEILRLVASGASNNQIGRELWITEQTVKFHLSNTYRKLGVANRTEASHFAHVNGMLTLDPAPPAWTPPTRDAVAA